jgi:chromate transporter
MRKKFVDQYHWIEEKEMLDLIAIAQCSPGAIAVNASILIGYRLAGILGSLVTILGTVLPPLLILSVISIAYTAFRDSVVVQNVLRGMQAGVAAVIVDVVITMAIPFVKAKKVLPMLVMLGAFSATYFFDINIIFIILICGIIGAISMYVSNHRKGGVNK